MNILVTGGSGLVGRSISVLISDLISDLIKDRNKVLINNNKDINNWIFLSSAECNLLDIEQVDKTFQKYKPDIIIHLAANVGGLYKNMKHNGNAIVNSIFI